uniref:GST N-terminal domain-containing protein n=1 Tax=Peronospora matthiolae TaxID=2874970 RepID=A0AAV1U3K9_9STRA
MGLLICETKDIQGVGQSSSTNQQEEYKAATNVTDTVNTNRAVPKVVRYQYEPCPYCCKVKAVLDYLKLPYDVVEVNPLTKKETKAVIRYAKVPVVTIGNDVVVDSSAIIARLWDLVVPAKSSQLEHKEPQEEEAQWCQWVDRSSLS